MLSVKWPGNETVLCVLPVYSDTCYPHTQVDVIISEWMVSVSLTFSFSVLKISPSLETTHSFDWAQSKAYFVI